MTEIHVYFLLTMSRSFIYIRIFSIIFVCYTFDLIRYNLQTITI